MGEGFATGRIGAGFDTLAPDGSEIRLLPALAGGSMAHCTLPPGGVSKAIVHRSVEGPRRGVAQAQRARRNRGRRGGRRADDPGGAQRFSSAPRGPSR